MSLPRVLTAGVRLRESFAEAPLYDGFDPLAPDALHADEHLVSLAGDEPRAHVSLWWRQVPELPGERLGLLGHYAAADDASAAGLLDAALARLATKGCTLAVGPMDGGTWRTYRFVTERGDEPRFFLEPDNPPDWPRQFEAAGFERFAGYSSALETDLGRSDPRLPAVESRLRSEGVRLRAADAETLEDELRRIHAVSLVSFERNVLYAPLPEDEFLALYRPLLPHVRPELVWLAEDGGAPVGFGFALPDMAEPVRGAPLRTAVVKTVAVLPGRRYGGLGAVIVERVREAARETGFTRAVHALMHDSNASRNISAHYGARIRGYTLYARRLR